MWVTLSPLALCLRQLCYDFDFGPFMNDAGFDPAKAVEGGTARRYGWALPILVVATPSYAWLRGLIDLGILVTHNFSLISLDLAQKVSKYSKEKQNKGFANLCNN
jgi:hypothetical protein